MSHACNSSCALLSFLEVVRSKKVLLLADNSTSLACIRNQGGTIGAAVPGGVGAVAVDGGGQYRSCSLLKKCDGTCPHLEASDSFRELAASPEDLQGAVMCIDNWTLKRTQHYSQMSDDEALAIDALF